MNSINFAAWGLDKGMKCAEAWMKRCEKAEARVKELETFIEEVAPSWLPENHRKKRQKILRNKHV